MSRLAASASVLALAALPAAAQTTGLTQIPYSMVGGAPKAGTTAGTFAAGNDPRITGAVQGGGAVDTNTVTVPGGVARTTNARAQDTVNTADYGVKCDGSTDDTAALQNVFSNIATFAKHVDLPGATCKISATIQVPGNIITVAGRGFMTTLQQTTAGADCLLFSPTNPAAGAAYLNGMENLRCQQTSATSTGAGFHLVRQTQFTARHFYSLDFFKGMLIEGGGIIHLFDYQDTQGSQWTSNVVGSAGLDTRPYNFTPSGGSATAESPSEVTLNGCNIGGTSNPANVQYGILDEGGDTLELNGYCHLGTTYTADLTLAPYQANTVIQTVKVGPGTYMDGSKYGPRGLYIPAFNTGSTAANGVNPNSGSQILDVHIASGAGIQNHTVAGIDDRNNFV